MASIALDPAYRRVSVEEFLDMDFGGAKAELEDGIIFMMAGGTPEHARVAARLIRQLGNALDGSGCEPVGSDLGVRTADQTIRYPDVSVYCGGFRPPENGPETLAGHPRVIIEVLSPSTAAHDQKVKLPEYQELAGVREIVFVDPAAKTVRIVARKRSSGWSDDRLRPDQDILFRSINVTITRSAIFDLA